MHYSTCFTPNKRDVMDSIPNRPCVTPKPTAARLLGNCNRNNSNNNSNPLVTLYPTLPPNNVPVINTGSVGTNVNPYPLSPDFPPAGRCNCNGLQAHTPRPILGHHSVSLQQQPPFLLQNPFNLQGRYPVAAPRTVLLPPQQPLSMARHVMHTRHVIYANHTTMHGNHVIPAANSPIIPTNHMVGGAHGGKVTGTFHCSRMSAVPYAYEQRKMYHQLHQQRTGSDQSPDTPMLHKITVEANYPLIGSGLLMGSGHHLLDPFEEKAQSKQSVVQPPQVPPLIDMTAVSPPPVDLSPSPKALCIALEEEEAQELKELEDDLQLKHADNDVQNQLDILLTDSSSCDQLGSENEDLQSPLAQHHDDPTEAAQLVESEDNRLPFAEFFELPEKVHSEPDESNLLSPKNSSSVLCSTDTSECSSSAESSFSDCLSNVCSSPLIVSIPFTSLNSSLEVMTTSKSPLTVSLPIEAWVNSRMKRQNRNEPDGKGSEPSHGEQVASQALDRDYDGQEFEPIKEQAASLTFESILLEESNLLTTKDINFIRNFMQGESVESTDSILRYAISKVPNENGDSKYSTIELDLTNHRWRGIIVDAMNFGFHNEKFIS